MFSREFAKYINGLSFDTIPDSAKEDCKKFVLDILGVTLRGSRTKQGKIAADFAKEFTEKKESSVIGYGFKTSCLNAAFANGVMAHAIDFDDTYEPSSIHVGCVLIPVALAIGERTEASGKDFMTAIIGGWDLSCRVASSIFSWQYRLGYHLTGISNCFGAAAVAGKLLKLNEDELVNALGIAGDQASGLLQYHYDGSMLKHFHAGKAAQNGILAALLAQRGFTGSPQILEGEWGFCKVLSGSKCDLAQLTEGLGTDFLISKTSFKPWPSCRSTHAPIEAALILQGKYHLDMGDIQRLILRLYSRAFESYNKPAPKNSLEALLSEQYCVASSLVRGAVSLDDFWSPEKLSDVRVVQLMGKIELVEDSELTKVFREKRNRPIELQIIMKDGRTFTQRVEYPLGSPYNPMSDSELANKFRDLASYALSAAKVKNLLNSAMKLEGIKNIGELVALLH